MNGRRIGIEILPREKTLREKIEAPAATRSILEKAWAIVYYADEHPPADPELVAAIEGLRGTLVRLDEIRTGA